jgi:hypothetical protein
MPTDSSLVPSCGCITRGSVEGIDGDAFKIPAVEGSRRPWRLRATCTRRRSATAQSASGLRVADVSTSMVNRSLMTVHAQPDPMTTR